MADHFPIDANLDALIEAALAQEDLLPVPVSLHANVLERVQLAALQAREQARFRTALLSGFAASAAIVVALALLVVMTNFHVLMKHGVSGGQGLFDYYATTFGLTWPEQPRGFFFALFAVLGVATVCASFNPRFWRRFVEVAHTARTGHTAAGQGPLRMP